MGYPGTRATAKHLTSRFVWPGILAQITRHTFTPLKRYESGDTQFDHINVDVVGPFPLHAGNRNCLTIIERFSRWPEAIPAPTSQKL